MMISLPDMQVLEIAGEDAANFAQAQFSSDARALVDGAWQWSAWLSAQGRVRAFFALLREDPAHWRLLLRGGDAESLRAALLPYVLRARVTLRVMDEQSVVGLDDRAAIAAGAMELPGLPQRWLALRRREDGVEPSAESREHWRLADIRAGLPELPGSLRDELLPQWLGLERLGAVSVAKGCYPGQEVMSRLHFKGGNKRSLYRLELRAVPPPQPGATLVTATGEMAGQIVSAAPRTDGSTEALAALVDASAAAPLRCTDATPGTVEVLQQFR
jgi:folate-binding protein YgfZ